MIQHSDSIATIMGALHDVQRDVDHVEKDSQNPHYGNTYTSLNAFLRALRGPLAEHGIIMTQAPSMDGENVTVETMLYHTQSGEWIRNRASSPMQKADPQGVGSAITYLRRYSLAALCAVPQEDDDGNAASRTGGRQNGQKATGETFHCPDCGSEMWDNRDDPKASRNGGKRPDFKCKDKDCDKAIWGNHPDESGDIPEDLVEKLRGMMNVATIQDQLTPDQAKRVEDAIKSGEKERAERALDWLRDRIDENAKAQTGMEPEEATV